MLNHLFAARHFKNRIGVNQKRTVVRQVCNTRVLLLLFINV